MGDRAVSDVFALVAHMNADRFFENLEVFTRDEKSKYFVFRSFVSLGIFI